MALVPCKECGSEVAGSAQACPRCGVAYPGGAGRLVIARRFGFTGATNAIKVIVGGKQIGQVNNGKSVTVEMVVGSYKIEVQGGGMSASTVAHIRDSQSTQYEVSFSEFGILGGGLKLKSL
jgi:hypothetical protein